MAENTPNIEPQSTQQPVQANEIPLREFIQVDTSTNAYMEKSDKSVQLNPKQKS